MAETNHWRELLGQRWRATPTNPLFELSEPSVEFIQALPADYLGAVNEFGGREGFLGQSYLRLYRLEELVSLNIAYDVQTYLPEIIVFGSNGGGDAFGFLLSQFVVVQVPFLPLSAEYLERRAPGFTAFVRALAGTEVSPPANAAAIGMELHEIHPICLGGSPADPTNKALIPAPKHAELCRFWNKVYRNALSRQHGNE